MGMRVGEEGQNFNLNESTGRNLVVGRLVREEKQDEGFVLNFLAPTYRWVLPKFSNRGSMLTTKG